MNMHAPTIRLSTGIRICNFSSPHPFNFTDGSVLPACSPERAKELMLVTEETETKHPFLPGVTDLRVTYKMSAIVGLELDKLSIDPTIDIILAPLPVLHAVYKQESGVLRMVSYKLRGVRVADRVSKTVRHDAFCVGG